MKVYLSKLIGYI